VGTHADQSPESPLRDTRWVAERQGDVCATCHAINQEGGTFGSDLTKSGGIWTECDVLEAIAFPSSSDVRSYELLLVKTRDGAEHLSILKNETSSELTLATGAPSEVRIPIACSRYKSWPLWCQLLGYSISSK
jgi:putative heme-binding domain-containing protein